VRRRRAFVPEPAVTLVLVELGILAVAQWFGGTPWTVIVALALVVESIGGLTPRGLWRIAAALVWVVAFHATGDRELFFPYSMQLAAHVGLRLAERDLRVGIAGGVMMATVFLASRIVQRATPRVLAVEGAVVVAILVGLVTIRQFLPARGRGWPDVALALGASLAAYAGLAL
jgi:hypothetical protein